MKFRLLTVGTAIAFSAAMFCLPAFAQDKSNAAKEKQAGAPDMQEMMKKMAELAAPGSAHKALEPLVGEWNVESRFWMGGPEPTVSKGTSSKRWILGGRFLQEDFKGEFMSMPFQGMGLTGYDKMKQKYVGMWIDSMGTAMSTSEGSANGDGKVITTSGTMDDPMSGEKNKPIKYVLRIAGLDKHVLEMHDPSLGDKSRIAEITYTRK